MNATMTVDEYRRAVATDTLPPRKSVDDKAYKKIIDKGGFQVIKNFTILGTADKPERQHIEDDHTEMVAQYLEILMMQGKVVEYTHTANETYVEGWKQKARNKAMGVRSGIPDFIIVFPNMVLFLELKRPDGGVVSPTQKRWMLALQGVGGGIYCRLAYGYDQAKETIDNCLLTTDRARE